MFGSIIQSSDIVGTSLAIATVATVTCAVLTFLGLTWSNERWRLPVALAGAALLPSYGVRGVLGLGVLVDLGLIAYVRSRA